MIRAARPPHGALWPLPNGGDWEGGTTDTDGNHWVHVPWEGWKPAPPNPFLVTNADHNDDAEEVPA